MDDLALLREYAGNQSEAGFAEIVRRYIDLVYSTALRRGGNAHLAEEISQAVFMLLSQKAGTLSTKTILSGWLYRATVQVSANALRAQRRRERREQQAAVNMEQPELNTAWEVMAPHLDEGLASLSGKDRDAIVLRFFQRKSLKEVAEILRTSDDAAQKRVSRALERLRSFFAGKDRILPTALIGSSLAAFAVQSAPVSLASSITSVAVQSSAVTLSTLALAKGTMNMIAWTKTHTAAVTALVALAAGTPLFIQTQKVSALSRENAQLRTENQQLRQPVLEREQAAFTDGPDLEKLRKEADEVHRLRGEVVQLRKQNQDLNEQAAKRARERAASKPLEGQLDPAVQEQAQRALFLIKMGGLKGIASGLFFYAQDHEGTLPNDLNDAVSYVPKPFADTVSVDEYEMVLHGKLDRIEAPMRVIVVKEKEATKTMQGTWAKTYGFADGHSEVHMEQDIEGFDRWEKSRTLASDSP